MGCVACGRELSYTKDVFKKKRGGGRKGGSLIGANPVTGGRLCQLKPHGPRPQEGPTGRHHPAQPTAHQSSLEGTEGKGGN